MSITLLQAVVEFSGKRALPVPSTVFGTTDAGILQIMRLLEEECIDLASRNRLQVLTKEISFTSLVTEVQGTISAGLGSGPTQFLGYRYMIPRTFWDRTQIIPVIGSNNPREYQWLKALNITGPYYSYRWIGDQLRLTPAPPAGHTLVFEYVSKFWMTTNASVAGSRFTADTDIILLPEDIIALGLMWRWLKTKGMPYAEDFDRYEEMVADMLTRDEALPVLDMSLPNPTMNTPRAGVVIPNPIG